MDDPNKTPGPGKSPNAARKITRRRVPGERDPVDVHIGIRLKQRRTLLGLSQEKLGEAIGLAFQQIQKFESGANRMGASRLFDMSYILDVPIEYFFEDMPEEIKKRNDKPADNLAEQISAENKGDIFTKRETLELVRAYYKVTSEEVRKHFLEMVKSLA